MIAMVRVSGGCLCKAEAPTETTVETRKNAEILTYFKAFNKVCIKFYRKDVQFILWTQVLNIDDVHSKIKLLI